MTTLVEAGRRFGLIVAPWLGVGCAGSSEDDGNKRDSASPAAWFENGCEEVDLEDRSEKDADRTVRFGEEGLTYAPKCLLISTDQTVVFEGNFAAHPLARGNPNDEDSGTGSSPIVDVSSGGRADFRFSEPGIYPYHCTIHSFNEGDGMAGVVVVR